VLREDLVCFDAERYGALLIPDPEDEFASEEIAKLADDVARRGLGLVVLADWHSEALVEEAAFFDDNTQVRWRAAVGGANVPVRRRHRVVVIEGRTRPQALNRLLAPFELAFGGEVYEGPLPDAWCDPGGCAFESGNALAVVPRGAYAVSAPALRRRRSNAEMRDAQRRLGAPASAGPKKAQRHALDPATPAHAPVVLAAAGRVVAFGDSACADDAHRGATARGGSQFCGPLLAAAVEVATTGRRNASVFPDAARVLPFGGGAESEAPDSRHRRRTTAVQLAPAASGLVSPLLEKYSRRRRPPGTPTSLPWTPRLRPCPAFPGLP